jgi:hypothetical protein
MQGFSAGSHGPRVESIPVMAFPRAGSQWAAMVYRFPRTLVGSFYESAPSREISSWAGTVLASALRWLNGDQMSRGTLLRSSTRVSIGEDRGDWRARLVRQLDPGLPCARLTHRDPSKFNGKEGNNPPRQPPDGGPQRRASGPARRHIPPLRMDAAGHCRGAFIALWFERRGSWVTTRCFARLNQKKACRHDALPSERPRTTAPPLKPQCAKRTVAPPPEFPSTAATLCANSAPYRRAVPRHSPLSRFLFFVLS